MWGTGSKYKGNYVHDVKQGYGEMYWADGSIYRGYWNKGVQSGVGLMIFKDGLRKAGFFINNIYEKPLLTVAEFQEFETLKKEMIIPEAFRQEIKEYIGLLAPTDDHTKYIGQEFNSPEVEDLMATNQFKNMQEIANAPFGPNAQITKEEYAKQVEELELAEAKLQNEKEP